MQLTASVAVLALLYSPTVTTDTPDYRRSAMHFAPAGIFRFVLCGHDMTGWNAGMRSKESSAGPDPLRKRLLRSDLTID